MKIRSRGHTLMLVLLLCAACAHDTRVTRLPTPPSTPSEGGGIVVVAAGDISCDPGSSKYNQGRGTARHCRMLATSDLATALKPLAVLLLGDNQYEMGAPDAYQKSWANNWGRKELRDITYPSVGNHEYKTEGASGYFNFSLARGPANAARGITASTWEPGTSWRSTPEATTTASRFHATKAQETWLRKDLERNPSSCTLAFWHRPLFTSGIHRDALEVKPFWRDLYEFNADVVLNGHSHHYERFSPQSPDGLSDPERGITQFVVGTGGKNLKGFWRKQRNSVVRNSKSFGVLKLELGQKGYEWEFISDGGEVLDRGSGQCHPKRESVTPKEGSL